MFDRLHKSWELAKASASVLKKDKELLVFPLLSAIATILVTASFAVPIFASGLHTRLDPNGDEARVLGLALAFLFYLCQYFVIFFANSALVSAALIRLRGGDPTVSDGLRIASKHVGAIFVYALISATFGMVLRALSERAGFIGRIVVALVGMAWNMATYLVVPVLVSEQIGPVDAISRSMSLLKKTWGEQVIANAGIGLVFNWLLLLSFFLFMGGAYVFAGVLNAPAVLLPLSGIFFMWVIGLCLLRATLSGIYAAALYRFAAEGGLGSDFDPQLVKAAFLPRHD